MRLSKSVPLVLLCIVTMVTMVLAVTALGPSAEVPSPDAQQDRIPPGPQWAPPDSVTGFYAARDERNLDPNIHAFDGSHESFYWDQLEPTEGDYQWHIIENFLATAEWSGKKAGFGIITFKGRRNEGDTEDPAMRVPQWVFDAGAGKISCPGDTNRFTNPPPFEIPKYWDETYLEKYENFVAALANEFDGDERLEFVQIGVGRNGETEPCDGSNPQYPNDESYVLAALQADGLGQGDWDDTVISITTIYDNHFDTTSLLLPNAPTFKGDNWARREWTDNAIAHGVGLFPAGMLPIQEAVDYRPKTDWGGRGIFDRILTHIEEYEAGTGSESWVPLSQEAYHYMTPTAIEYYWAVLGALRRRIDYVTVEYEVLYDADTGQRRPDFDQFVDVMRWARAYMGKSLAESPSVWVALREAGYTDAFYPQKGNYGWFLYQDDSIPGGRTKATTYRGKRELVHSWDYDYYVPLYGEDFLVRREIETDQSFLGPSREGWICRRTDQASENTRIYFRIDDRFVAATSTQAVIEVTYFDRGYDTWQLVYDALGNSNKVARTVTKTNTNTWRTESVLVSDAYFGNRANGGVDLYIDGRNDGDEYIHMVDVDIDGEPTPTPTFTPTTTPTLTPTATPTLTPTLLPTPKPGPSVRVPGLYGTDDWQDALLSDIHLVGLYQEFYWDTLEPSEGARNWQPIDDFLAGASSKGKAGAIGIVTFKGRSHEGNAADPAIRVPQWVFDAGAGKVACTGDPEKYPVGDPRHDNPPAFEIPKFWDPIYLAKYEAFVAALGARYDGDPRIEYVQIGVGRFGGTEPSDGSDDTCVETALQSDGHTKYTWGQVTVPQIVGLYDQHFDTTQLLLPNGATYLVKPDRKTWTDDAYMRGVGLFPSALMAVQENVDYRTHPTWLGVGIYDRILQHWEEFEAGLAPEPWVVLGQNAERSLAPDYIEFYWSLLGALRRRVDYITLDKGLLFDGDVQRADYAEFVDILRWTQKQMGKTLSESPSIWVALREAGYSDGWYPQKGNYHRGLYQLPVAGGRSIPTTYRSKPELVHRANYDYWVPLRGEDFVVRPEIETGQAFLGPSAEGWICRRTDVSTGNPIMAFDVDDRLLDGGTHVAVITVTYLDRGLDTWELRYDGSSSPNTLAGTIQKRNTNRWKKAYLRVDDAVFLNRQQGGADLRLDAGSGDEYIHMVEIAIDPDLQLFLPMVMR